MNRSGPIKRYTALKPSGFLRRSAEKLARRVAICRQSLKARRRQVVWRRCFEHAAFANDGYCVWPGCFELATEGHHILPRSRGGEDTIDNCAPVCHCCHRRIHDYPLLAGKLGLLKTTEAK